MIALSMADCVIILVILAVTALKIVADIREVAATRRARRPAAEATERNFRPAVTAIIRLHSIDGAKNTIAHFTECYENFHVVLIIDTDLHPKAAGALRYFVKKQSLKNVRIVTQKRPNVMWIIKRYVKSDIVAILPETAKLEPSFYRQVIVPFVDRACRAVATPRRVRVTQTISSAVEALNGAWWSYLSRCYTSRRVRTGELLLSRGAFVRTSFVTADIEAAKIHRSARSGYNVAAQNTALRTASVLHRGMSAKLACCVAVGTLLAAFAITLNVFAITAMLLAVATCMAWWSTAALGISFILRISLLFVSPIFYLVLVGVALGRIVLLFTKGFSYKQSPRQSFE